MGVDLFFVLSGYLIGSQMLREQVRTGGIHTGQFYRRRAFRILPAYFVVLALYLFVPALRGNSPASRLGGRSRPSPRTCSSTRSSAPSHTSGRSAWRSTSTSSCPCSLPPSCERLQPAGPPLVISAIVLGGIALRAYALFSGAAFMTRIYYPTYMRLDGLVMGVTLATVRTFRPAWWSWLAERGHGTMLSGTCLVAPVVWMFHDDVMGDTTGRGAWAMCSVFRCSPLDSA